MKLKLSENQDQWTIPSTNWTNAYTEDTNKELIIDSNFYVARFKNMKSK
ncbi:MAG: hypothetical protein WBG42_06350 [Cryomorphaceae bacterium]